MRVSTVFALVTVLAATRAPRGWSTYASDASATSTPAMAANVLIVKSHADIERWVTTDPAKREGDFGRMRTVTRGPKIYLPVIATFSNSQIGESIALRGVVQLVSPSGNTLMGARCLANQVDPRAPKTIVLEPVLYVFFDATDPNGEYKVRASIRRGTETAVANEKFRLQ